jgi:DNA-binding response OmpR family regulator
MDDSLTKPIDRDQLRATLMCHLNPAARNPSSTMNEKFSLDGKVALVTGGTSGTG